MILIGLMICQIRPSIIWAKLLNTLRSWSMSQMKISVRMRNPKRRKRKRRKKKINKKSNSLRKMTITLIRPVTRLLMMRKKIWSPYKNSRNDPFLTSSIWGKWWVGLRDNLCMSILSQVKDWKGKKSKNFWWKRKLKFMKRMVRTKKWVKETEKPHQRRIRTGERTTTKRNWSFSNFLKTLR